MNKFKDSVLGVNVAFKVKKVKGTDGFVVAYEYKKSGEMREGSVDFALGTQEQSAIDTAYNLIRQDLAS